MRALRLVRALFLLAVVALVFVVTVGFFSSSAASPSIYTKFLLDLGHDVDVRSIEVMALEGGTTLRAGEYQVALTRYERGWIPAENLAQGIAISGSGPFVLGGEAILAAPETFAGQEFVIPHVRAEHLYFLLSP